MDTDTRAARLARDLDRALAALTTTLRTDRDAILARVALGLATVADVALLGRLGLDARTYAPPPEDPTGPHGG